MALIQYASAIHIGWTLLSYFILFRSLVVYSSFQNMKCLLLHKWRSSMKNLEYKPFSKLYLQPLNSFSQNSKKFINQKISYLSKNKSFSNTESSNYFQSIAILTIKNVHENNSHYYYFSETYLICNQMKKKIKSWDLGQIQMELCLRQRSTEAHFVRFRRSHRILYKTFLNWQPKNCWQIPNLIL